jgi:type II secretory ATPase GspE/PulE/Tfp pilus assembly ATPase PilB-like protein
VDESRETIIDRIADDAPVVNLLNSILLEALSRRVSDIHSERKRDKYPALPGDYRGDSDRGDRVVIVN